MTELDTRIEELNKKIREQKYRLEQFKESQAKYEENKKNNPVYVEVQKFLKGEMTIPIKRNTTFEEKQKMINKETVGVPSTITEYKKQAVDLQWLEKNKPELYQSYMSLNYQSFAPTIDKLKSEILSLQQTVDSLKTKKEKDREAQYEQILGMKIVGNHDVDLVDENGIVVRTRKTDQELNVEIGKLKIRLNDLEQSGQIDEDIHEELLDYMETKYSQIRLENSKNSLNNNLSPEQQADAIIQAMANGKIDTNGQPIVQNQEIISNNRTMGFAKVWVLGILTAIASIGIIVIGVFLNK